MRTPESYRDQLSYCLKTGKKLFNKNLTVRNIIEEIQDEAYNQAIDDASRVAGINLAHRGGIEKLILKLKK